MAVDYSALNRIDPYSSPESVLHREFLGAASYLERALNVALAPAGVSSAQFYILLLLHPHERPLTPKEIGAAPSIGRYNLTEIVDRMERYGLVRRLLNPDDRRSRLIEITDQGRAAAMAGLNLYTPFIRTLLADLSPGQIQDTSQVLNGLKTTARQMHDQSSEPEPKKQGPFRRA